MRARSATAVLAPSRVMRHDGRRVRPDRSRCRRRRPSADAPAPPRRRRRPASRSRRRGTVFRARQRSPAASTANQRALIDRVSLYLSTIQTLVGDFVQVGPDGTRTEGQLYLQKPGKIRFEYKPPSVIEVVADGSSVVVRDRKLATQDLYPLSQTPLRYLLAERIDLSARHQRRVARRRRRVRHRHHRGKAAVHRHQPPDDDVRRQGPAAAAMDGDRPAGLRHHRRGLQPRRQQEARSRTCSSSTTTTMCSGCSSSRLIRRCELDAHPHR